MPECKLKSTTKKFRITRFSYKKTSINCQLQKDKIEFWGYKQKIQSQKLEIVQLKLHFVSIPESFEVDFFPWSPVVFYFKCKFQMDRVGATLRWVILIFSWLLRAAPPGTVGGQQLAHGDRDHSSFLWIKHTGHNQP